MESKGFGESNVRTHYTELRARPLDIAFPALTCALLLAAAKYLA
jgi:energy-coupling factor transporter transmembrane protein EcfT